MMERRQLAKIISESEYDSVDRIRSRAADEQSWMDFEQRMRQIIKEILEPIIEMTTTDREQTFDVEL